ncbi:MAG TPA: SDR family oxidoreductase [Acidobacteriaceae bacterium]|nr:SDR family oxidoreductase [Acidobacteriaceae bacterium]
MTERRISTDEALNKSNETANLPLQGKTALVTGASRGIGASVARQLAQSGASVGINYRSKAPRAEQVAKEIAALGREALLLQADITQELEIRSMFKAIDAAWQKLDVIVLNASGGLEKAKASDYAMTLNRDAQVNLAREALRRMPAGGCIVFVTSHLAHFYGSKSVSKEYEPVAASKKAGEEALRRMLPEMSASGVRLVVISGDLIEGTITPKLLQKHNPGLIAQRKMEAGSLPDVKEFAAAIVEGAIHTEWESGRTVYVGSTEWA